MTVRVLSECYAHDVPSHWHHLLDRRRLSYWEVEAQSSAQQFLELINEACNWQLPQANRPRIAHVPLGSNTIAGKADCDHLHRKCHISEVVGGAHVQTVMAGFKT